MIASASIIKLSEALVKAQANMGAALKGASNPYFKSKYSDLNSVIEACKGPLNEQGITVLQPVSSDEHGDYVETILIHTSGEFIASKMRIKTQKENDMQAFGSGVSYARRYALQSFVFIPSSEDDDAEGTMVRTTPAKALATETAVAAPTTAASNVTSIEDAPKTTKASNAFKRINKPKAEHAAAMTPKAEAAATEDMAY